jgi:DNA processing protein
VTGPADQAFELPPGAYAAALASLPCAGPAWLVDVLAQLPPQRAWELVAAGALAPPPRTRLAPGGPAWADVARRLDVGALWARCRQGGIDVSWPGLPSYPRALLRCPSPAGVLFSVGHAGVSEDRACVAVIGTRRCTPEGAAVAYQLGYDLSCAGVCVVSGLAIGIDGAAHAGALAAAREQDGRPGATGPADAGEAGAPGDDPCSSGAPSTASAGRAGSIAGSVLGTAAGSTIGVAASGVDVVYPRQHGALWREVTRLGAIVSETPPGVQAKAWRFPSRNRLIAGLARMVVVVECHVSGGSWHTVEAAIRQGLDVGAVPGSVHSSASVGTNTLIHEGATPVRDAQDVLDALGVFETRHAGLAVKRDGVLESLPGSGLRSPLPARPRARTERPGRPGRVVEAAGAGLGTLDEKVFASLSWRPLCLEEIVERSGLPAGAVVVSLDRLEQQGRATGDDGWWVAKHP